MLLKRVFIVYICLISVHIGCGAQTHDSEQSSSQKDTDNRCSRIVSLAPSITETLFALGLGDHVAGVTRFCTYPPEAAEKPSIGGYLDPNYETMAKLKPGLALLLPEHDGITSYLDQLGIRHETVHNRTVAEIMETIEKIGVLCGAETKADSLIAVINQRMESIQNNIPSGYHPRVIVSIGRTMGTGTLQDVYVAGGGTFYDQLIELAGGDNAINSDNIDYPLLSAEGLLHINPDIIFDLVPDFEKKGYDRELILNEWKTLGNVTAITDSSVYLLTGDYTVIPGPRFIFLLEDMANIIQKNIHTQ